MKSEKTRKFAFVYMDFKDGKPYWYIRVGGVETNRFPHGLGLHSFWDEKEHAEEFADEVEAYMKQVVKSSKKKQF